MGLGGLIEHHAYGVTATLTFLACTGIPMPVSVALLIAGASAHGGHLSLFHLLPLVWFAASFGDTLLYLGGRFTGWWLLAFLAD